MIATDVDGADTVQCDVLSKTGKRCRRLTDENRPKIKVPRAQQMCWQHAEKCKDDGPGDSLIKACLRGLTAAFYAAAGDARMAEMKAAEKAFWKTQDPTTVKALEKEKSAPAAQPV